jgi:magnesium-transporting ATPase (P-type)
VLNTSAPFYKLLEIERYLFALVTVARQASCIYPHAGGTRPSGVTRVELPNLVFAGTSVAAGTGTAVVCATGMASEFGTIAHLTQAVGDERSPLFRTTV